MNRQLLLPNKFKKTGWLILITGIITAILFITYAKAPTWLTVKVLSLFNEDSNNGFYGIIENNIADEIIAVLLLAGSLLVMFSKEKEEDEAIAKLRLKSLQWAFLINYSIILLAAIFIYDYPFAKVMMYNMFTVPFIFIARFNFLLHTTNKSTYYEKYIKSAESHS